MATHDITIKKYIDGTGWEVAYPETTVDQIVASGTPNSTTFLRGDGAWATPGGLTPAAVTTFTATEQTDYIKLSISQVTNADRYEVWASVGDELSYDLIAIINENQIDTTMTVDDYSYGVTTGTIYYKVYAFSDGLQSAATSTSVTLSSQVLPDVSNLIIIAEEDIINIEYDIPADPRVQGVNVYVGTATSGDPTKPSNPNFTGYRTNYTYTIATADRTKNFRVWVETY